MTMMPSKGAIEKTGLMSGSHFPVVVFLVSASRQFSSVAWLRRAPSFLSYAPSLYVV